jgi:hypothetical protein
MAKRYVIENQQQQAELRPIASPVDTFAPPIIQAPEMQNIIDLAPLSKSFTDLASSVAAGVGEEVQKSAAAAYADAGSNVKSALENKNPEEAKKQLAALSRSKQIPEHYQPLFYKSLYMFGAKDAMVRYESALKQELDKFATVVDENGNFMPEPAKAPEIVAQELWNNFASSPILANYDGRVEASKYLGNIQSNFIAAATETRAAALKQWRGEQIEKDWGQSLLKMIENPEEANKEIQVKLAEARELGMPDIYKKLTSSTIAAAASLKSRAAVSKNRAEQAKLFDQAVRILTLASDIQIGEAKLGSNLNTQADLDAAIESVEVERDKAERQGHEDTSRAGLRDGIIANVRKQNLPPTEERSAVISALTEQYGEASEGVLAGADNYDRLRKAETAEPVNDPETVRLIEGAILNKDFDLAELLLQRGFEDRKINNPLPFSNQISESRQSRQRVADTPQARRSEEAVGSKLNEMRSIVSQLPAREKYVTDLGDLEREFDADLMAVSNDSSLSTKDRDAQLQKLRDDYISKVDDVRKGLEQTQKDATDKLRKRAVGELNLDNAAVAELESLLDPNAANAIQKLHDDYFNPPQWVINPQAGAGGEFTDYYSKLGQAFNSAMADLGATSKANVPEELNNARSIIEDAISPVKTAAYREAIKQGLNRVDQQKYVASAVTKAVQDQALPAIEKLVSPDTYNILVANLASPKVAAQLTATNTYLTKSQAGRSWNESYMMKYDKPWSLGLMYDETDVEDQAIGGILPMGLDRDAYKEGVAETFGLVHQHQIALKNPQSVRALRGAQEAAQTFKAYPQYYREQFLDTQFKGWQYKNHVMNDPAKASALMESVVQNFGLTTSEVISGKVVSTNTNLNVNGVRLRMDNLNPAYTPFFMDIPGKGQYEGVRTGLPTLQEFFKRASDLPEGTEGNLLKSTLNKLNIPDTLENREMFIRDQLTAHSRFYN